MADTEIFLAAYQLRNRLHGTGPEDEQRLGVPGLARALAAASET
ncbi:hypothetical protein [Streptomyces sp. WM6386]|nr:hypothetical protein [Streptomyces sp. WM6386]